MISSTTIDETGIAVNGESGYATISYEYDDNRNVIREFRTDDDGNGVANSYRSAGYRREYDFYSNMILEQTIGTDGMPVANNVGYAEVRREYSGSKLLMESYYNTAGQPVNRLDSGYAIVQMEYDDYKNRISEKYFDRDGRLS